MPKSPALPLSARVMELGVEARYHVRSELRSFGIWPEDVEQSILVRQRAMRGVALSEQLLPACLGVDARAPGGPSEPGRGIDLLWIRSGNLLTFGYEVARAFSVTRRWRTDEHSGPSIAALMNLLVVAFDKQCDRMPKEKNALLEHFNRSTLISLCHDPNAAVELRTLSALVKESETRVVLKILSEVFRRLHKVRLLAQGGEVEWDLLLDWISRGFDAQLATLDGPSLEQVKVKSIAPLEIIFSVMKFTRHVPDTRGAEEEFRFSSSLSHAIWLIDDIADLKKDYRSGAANSIIMSAKAHQEPDQRVLEKCLIDSCNIALESIYTFSTSLLRCNTDVAAQLERTLLSYIRSWLS